MQIGTSTINTEHDLSRILFDDREHRARLIAIQDRTILLLLDGAHEYPIPADRCASHEAIVWWLSHLAPKTWVTKDHLREFIHAACFLNGLEAEGHV